MKKLFIIFFVLTTIQIQSQVVSNAIKLDRPYLNICNDNEGFLYAVGYDWNNMTGGSYGNIGYVEVNIQKYDITSLEFPQK